VHAFAEAERAQLARRPETARRIAADTAVDGPSTIDTAAWTLAGNVLLNLDETVTKN
jgi:hypothetical protein